MNCISSHIEISHTFINAEILHFVSNFKCTSHLFFAPRNILFTFSADEECDNHERSEKFYMLALALHTFRRICAPPHTHEIFGNFGLDRWRMSIVVEHHVYYTTHWRCSMCKVPYAGNAERNRFSVDCHADVKWSANSTPKKKTVSRKEQWNENKKHQIIFNLIVRRQQC